jgi:two-component system, chemotaxis family, CheB/CheR fusion protein
VLNKDLTVRHVNRAFYDSFKVRAEETEGHFIGDLGNGQWNIPKLLSALEEILPQKGGFESFEIEHGFESIGHLRRSCARSADGIVVADACASF